MHVGISRLFLQGCGICRVNSEYQASPRGQTGDKARDKGAHFTTDKPSWYCMAWLQLVSYPDPPPIIAISANQIVPPKFRGGTKMSYNSPDPLPLRGLKGGSGYEISLVLVWLQWATPTSLRSSSLIFIHPWTDLVLITLTPGSCLATVCTPASTNRSH